MKTTSINHEDITFIPVTKSQEITKVFDHNIDAFSDSPDFKWTLDDIKKEIADEWYLFSVEVDGEIIAAAFHKLEGEVLHCKNTSVKMQFTGSGFSHRIMDFFESEAKKLKAKSIIHYCSIDNFRQYSLNESHGYTKTDRRLGKNGHTTEWVKLLKKG